MVDHGLVVLLHDGLLKEYCRQSLVGDEGCLSVVNIISIRSCNQAEASFRLVASDGGHDVWAV